MRILTVEECKDLADRGMNMPNPQWPYFTDEFREEMCNGYGDHGPLTSNTLAP